MLLKLPERNSVFLFPENISYFKFDMENFFIKYITGYESKIIIETIFRETSIKNDIYWRKVLRKYDEKESEETKRINNIRRLNSICFISNELYNSYIDTITFIVEHALIKKVEVLDLTFIITEWLAELDSIANTNKVLRIKQEQEAIENEKLALEKKEKAKNGLSTPNKKATIGSLTIFDILGGKHE